MAKKATDKGSRSTRRSKTMPETKPSTAVPPDENARFTAFATRWQKTIKDTAVALGTHPNNIEDVVTRTLMTFAQNGTWGNADNVDVVSTTAQTVEIQLEESLPCAEIIRRTKVPVVILMLGLYSDPEHQDEPVDGD